MVDATRSTNNTYTNSTSNDNSSENIESSGEYSGVILSPTPIAFTFSSLDTIVEEPPPRPTLERSYGVTSLSPPRPLFPDLFSQSLDADPPTLVSILQEVQEVQELYRPSAALTAAPPAELGDLNFLLDDMQVYLANNRDKLTPFAKIFLKWLEERTLDQPQNLDSVLKEVAQEICSFHDTDNINRRIPESWSVIEICQYILKEFFRNSSTIGPNNNNEENELWSETTDLTNEYPLWVDAPMSLVESDSDSE